MEQSLSSEANKHSTSQEVSLLCTQKPATGS